MRKLFLVIIGLSSLSGFAQTDTVRYRVNDMPIDMPPLSYSPLRVSAPPVPKNFSLFGERMPMEIRDVRERFDRELMVNQYMQGTTAYIVKLTTRWLPFIEERLAANGVPDDFKYLCVAESALQNQVSKAGAVGFWQFMSGTALLFGLYIDGEVDERYNVEKSTDAACQYLKSAYAKLGNWTNAAASYNCGVAGLQNALNAQGENSFYNTLLPDETMRYIFRIAALKYILSNHERMGFRFNEEDMYKPLLVKRDTINTGLGSLVDYAKLKGTHYKTLKVLNPWLRDKELKNAKGRNYVILLPID